MTPMTEPKNELGVIVLFAQSCRSRGLEIVSIQAQFPDAQISDAEGHEYAAEFELFASHFYSHKHDPRHCDVIICWKNNTDSCALPVIELCNPDWAMVPQNILASETEKEAEYWKHRAGDAERQLKRLKTLQEAWTSAQEEMGRFPCPLCDKIFETQNGLNAHQRVHGNGQRVKAREVAR